MASIAHRCTYRRSRIAGPRRPGTFQGSDVNRTRLALVAVLATTRTTRTRGSTPACAAAGCESKAEDFYTLWSIALNPKTARVTDGHEKPVGSFAACLGATVPNEPFK